MRRYTKARRLALQWFADHEREPLSVLMADKPTPRMRRLMVKEGHVARIPVGQFGFDKWVLTYAGREALALGYERASNDQPQP